MASFNPDIFAGDPFVVDNPEALETSLFSARDVPQDWADANPYEIETAPEAGSGYEMDGGLDMSGMSQMGMDPGMGTEMGMEDMMGMDMGQEPQGARMETSKAETLRDTMVQRMQSDNQRSENFQQKNRREKKRF